jgi:mono/diheme cytochrome c family protein
MVSAPRSILAMSLFALLSSSGIGARADVSGRDLYQGLVSFSKGRSATDLALPSDYAACVNCHGTRGLGSSEGAGVVPSLRWADLTSPRGNAPAFTGAEAVALAITKRRSRAGTPLSSAMPRYNLDSGEAQALLNYLKVLGSRDDVARGVSDTSIRFATLVPLTGPLANAGNSIRAGIETSFFRINERGGVFGRKVELVAIDSAQSHDQIEKALQDENIYALVGSLWRHDVDLEVVLARRHMSAIASITTSEREGGATVWNFPLLGNRADQAKLLVTALSQCPGEKPVWTIKAETSQAVPHAGEVRQFSSIGELKAALMAQSVTGCLGLTLGQFESVGKDLAPGWQKIIVLPFPAGFLKAEPDVWHGLGEAAAEILLELLANAGQSLHERALLDHLADLDGFAPLDGLSIPTRRKAASAFPPEIITVETLQNIANPLPKPD